MRRILGPLPLMFLWALPLFAAIARALAGVLDSQAWTAILHHPQAWTGLTLALATGAASTLLALLLALIILAGFYRSRAWNGLQAVSAAGLSLPHLSFAIGLGFLIMPSGPLARILVGGDAPPQWISVHDPLGVTLCLGLALKEVPFLVALGWSALSQGDAARALDAEVRAARSLGHGTGSAWLRIVQPQLLQRLAWPILIVFAYGASVVDMAIAIGPTQPPTLAVVIWHDLNDADAATNARGLAGALLLTAAIAFMAAVGWTALRLSRTLRRNFHAAGPSRISQPWQLAWLAFAPIGVFYILAMMVLVLMSVSMRWPYPDLLPVAGGEAWLNLIGEHPALWASLGIGLACSALSALLAVLWFECVNPIHDRWLMGLAVLSLLLPQIVIAAGQYRLFLDFNLTGTMTGVFLAHLTPVAAYVMIVLAGPYRAFDQRYVRAARALRASPLRSWIAIKAPLLKAPLLTALAVGFGVSMVQFVPAQLTGAGRIVTMPVEAVTLSTGGDRALTSAFALALALPPLTGFLLAGILGRPRWR